MRSIQAPTFPIKSPINSFFRPRFTIITATYNSGVLFDRTAQSLRDQTYNDFEWLVIDGASTDDTLSRIDSHSDLITYFKSEKDRGISDAWNKGLSISQGDYVLILNAGDTYEPNFLELINRHVSDSNLVICSHAHLVSETGEALGIIRSEPHKLNRAMHLAHNWCAVPRKHYEQLGGYIEMKLAMDFEWFHRYYRHYGINGFTVVDLPLGKYHLGGTSDINYIESFAANSDILIHYGTNRAVANLWRILYTSKNYFHNRKFDKTQL